MITTATQKSGKQLWGIYHTDREYARELGDPLRTVVEAPTKQRIFNRESVNVAVDQKRHSDCYR